MIDIMIAGMPIAIMVVLVMSTLVVGLAGILYLGINYTKTAVILVFLMLFLLISYVEGVAELRKQKYNIVEDTEEIYEREETDKIIP